jgi:hypothetical protein
MKLISFSPSFSLGLSGPEAFENHLNGFQELAQRFSFSPSFSLGISGPEAFENHLNGFQGLAQRETPS